jgi:hypothetical protein
LSRVAIHGEDWFAVLVGVCNNEKSVTEVRGTNGCRRNAIPFRIEPEVGQIGEDGSKPKGKVPWDVLQQDDAWS